MQTEILKHRHKLVSVKLQNRWRHFSKQKLVSQKGLNYR